MFFPGYDTFEDIPVIGLAYLGHAYINLKINVVVEEGIDLKIKTASTEKIP